MGKIIENVEKLQVYGKDALLYVDGMVLEKVPISDILITKAKISKVEFNPSTEKGLLQTFYFKKPVSCRVSAHDKSYIECGGI